jgi:hypothetical protein
MIIFAELLMIFIAVGQVISVIIYVARSKSLEAALIYIFLSSLAVVVSAMADQSMLQRVLAVLAAILACLLVTVVLRRRLDVLDGLETVMNLAYQLDYGSIDSRAPGYYRGYISNYWTILAYGGMYILTRGQILDAICIFGFATFLSIFSIKLVMHGRF